MPILYIDKTTYEVKAGKNLLEACLALGFDLPYFCWHPALGSVGACRQCAVKLFKDEKDEQGKLVMSCMEGVKDGLHLSIDDPAAKAFREQVIEWLMTNHPHDCPVCDEGGSCHLQDMTVMTGHDYRRYHFKKRTYRNQYLGPLIHHEMNRCIQCYRCVRYYHDYAGGDDLNVYAAHDHVYFGRAKDGVLESPFSGNLAEVCPTGVFTDKTLKEHYTRKWDLTMAPSVCQHCSVGCNTIAGERYGEVRCMLNRYNGEVNGYFLCDRGRYGYEFVNSENRIRQPLIRYRTAEAVTETDLLDFFNTSLHYDKLIGIGSPRASVESNFALQQLVGAGNFYQGLSDNEAYLTRRVVQLLQSGAVHSVSLKQIEQADAVVIIGEDIWNTAPMMALAVRQSVNKAAAADASQQSRLPQWHDAAIKELVQDAKGFLANITVADSALDGMATQKYRGAPDDIARLGFAVAHELNTALPEVSRADASLLDQAKAIAAVLQKAQRPVIISGISCYAENIIKAAFDIAAALSTDERKAGIAYVLPECNSMGLALLKAPSFEQAMRRVNNEANLTAIILETDLYRNMPQKQVDGFLKNCERVIALDTLHNRTTEKAHVLIPAATFAEGDGTLVNYEGRAQRFCQVFAPSNKAIKESWRWLWTLKALKTGTVNGHDQHPDTLLELLESTMPQFEGIHNVAPPHNFTIHGERIPRETQRYSGRTAILANINVSEPGPPQDEDSPLTFTMEGYKGMPPAPLIPFFWSPGWNSIQSVSKYQVEPGGALRGGDPGILMCKDKTGVVPTFFKDIPLPFMPRLQKWLLLPHYHVLGSGELSSYSKALQQLSPKPFAALSPLDAARMGLRNGDIFRFIIDETEQAFPVKIMEHLQSGLLLVSAGLDGQCAMSWGSWARVETETLQPSELSH